MAERLCNLKKYSQGGGSSELEELLAKSQLTESDMIKILDKGWFYSAFIGSEVVIDNSSALSNVYQIIDLGHDNSGNAFDLMAKTSVYTATTFGSSENYSASSIRTWLNGTYYDGFSADMQSHIVTMVVNSNNTTLNDKVKLPSYTEYGFSSYNGNVQIVEGTVYKSMYYFYLSAHVLRTKFSGGGAMVLQIGGTSASHTTMSGNKNVVPIFRLGQVSS